MVAIGFVLLLVHNLDEAFFHPEPGGTANVVQTVVVGVLVVVLYRRLGRWWRAGMTGVVGLSLMV